MWRWRRPSSFSWRVEEFCEHVLKYHGMRVCCRTLLCRVVEFYVLGRYRSSSRVWTPRSALEVELTVAVRASVAMGWGPRLCVGPSGTAPERNARNVRHPRAVHDASAEDSSVPIKGGEDAADGLDETRPSRLITLMPGDASGDLNESHHALPSRLATDASSSHVPPLEGIPLRFCGVQGESNVEREGEDIIGAMTSETDGKDGRAKEVRHPKYSAG